MKGKSLASGFVLYESSVIRTPYKWPNVDRQPRHKKGNSFAHLSAEIRQLFHSLPERSISSVIGPEN
jgi:hypothetical protein